MILIRDTTDRDGFTLSVPAQAWAKFTATIKLARHPLSRLRSVTGARARVPSLPPGSPGLTFADEYAVGNFAVGTQWR